MNDNRGQFLNHHTVQFERLLPGPIERVFDFLSKPELLEKWLMPAKVEQFAGGRIEFKSGPIPESVSGQTSSASHCHIRGIISAYEPPHLIAYSWNELDYDMATEVRFELEQRDDKVLLRLTHSRIPAHLMAGVGAGWHTHLDDLFSAITGLKPGDFFERFNPLLVEYKALLVTAGIVAATVAAPAAAASADTTLETLRDARRTLLVQYDRLWKDADLIKSKLLEAERSSDSNRDRDIKDLQLDLKQTAQDLRKLEYQLKDLESALR